MRFIRPIPRACERVPAFLWTVFISMVILSPLAWTLPLPSLYETQVTKTQDRLPLLVDVPKELEPIGVAYAIHPWVNGTIPPVDYLTRLHDDEPIVPKPVKTITIKPEKKKQKRSDIDEVIRKASPATLLAYAKAEVGKRGPQLGLPSRLWCMDFATYLLRKVGLPSTGSRMARSPTTSKNFVKVTKPVPGDFVILPRGRNPTYGHIAVYGGKCKGGMILVGGNQRGGRVSQDCYRGRNPVAIVRPKAIANDNVASINRRKAA